MKNKILYIFLFLASFVNAQELNCIVTVNSDKITTTNKQIFQTLQRSLTDFVNKTSWTGRELSPNEKINCSMFISVSAQDNDLFTATIQVQTSRPIYNSTYTSSIFNYNDKEFTFNYTEFQNLNYNPNSFDSNLVSVVAFYSAMIIGIDADTFALNGGTEYLEIAREIANVAQSSGYAGWTQAKGNNNRYSLINDMLSNTYSPYRLTMYQYHLEGLDTMTKDMKASKEKIKAAIAKMKEVHNVRPNAFITRTFFDAKTDEIVSIFSGGPSITITDLVDDLNKISPLNSSKWASIKF
ncbi:MAG: DUF4835 family protein [Flavobacterium sp.]|uniref:type IX secretion system protein PorD n=1 Tax=Flavobacterium sp. TaxID=239 RepID=UPI0022C38065|nr:DUF4835 family protein [Flavobacterium sp.]MCZ8196851.1 DUF4835 family protein [Flavobacterium sp.]